MAFPLPALLTAPEFLPALLDLSISGVVCYAPLQDAAGHIQDFAFTYVNATAQRLLGVPAQPTATYCEQFPDARPTGGFAFHCAAYEAGGEPQQLAGNYQAGPYNHYFRIAARRVGEQLLVSFTTSDEQDRNAVEQALRESQARDQTTRVEAETQRLAQERDTFYQVFAQTPAAICIQRGPDHRYEYANQAYRDFFPGRPLIGQSVAEALPETVAGGIVALLDRVYQTGETYSGVELPLLIAQPQGPPRQMYFTFTYQAYREQGEIVGISTFAYDVAEQVRARQQREAQQGQLRQLFEQAPVAIAVFEGPDYVVEVANPRVAELWGRTPVQVVGLPLFEALPEIDPAFRPLLDGVVQTGQAYAAQEVATPLLRASGVETVYLNFVYEPLRDATGAITRVAAVATDVTGQVLDRLRVQELNDELSASNQQLTRTNVDLDTFVYTASHDLKAPIANIEGLLLALRQELPTQVAQAANVAELLTLMDGAVARFQRTIGHLTDVSKIQPLHAEPAEPVDLAALLEAVRLDLPPALLAEGELRVDVATCPVLHFSAKNLRSILYNLLSNAFKYRDPARPPLVRLRCRREPGRLVLEVQDNGLGLSDEQQTKLFKMFQRLHTHVEGTGVGLYMVKRMVENANGTIRVQSQVGVGSTFTVELPAPA